MTLPLRPEDLYHTGVVVADLEAEMARLTALAGYQWTNPLTYTVPVRTAQGTRDLTPTLVYSLQSPHLELVQEIPGTPWVAAPGNSIHHIGYFVDNLAEAGAALEGAGFTQEATADLGEPGPAMFAYYKDELGTRIEIVDRALFPDWGAFLQALTA